MVYNWKYIIPGYSPFISSYSPVWRPRQMSMRQKKYSVLYFRHLNQCQYNIRFLFNYFPGAEAPELSQLSTLHFQLSTIRPPRSPKGGRNTLPDHSPLSILHSQLSIISYPAPSTPQRGRKYIAEPFSIFNFQLSTIAGIPGLKARANIIRQKNYS